MMRPFSRRPLFRQLSLMAVIVITALSFQNCSSRFLFNGPPSKEGVLTTASLPGPTATPATQAQGNGHGYDGKPFVLIDLTCADTIRARLFVQEDGSGLLTREDCVDITPRSLLASSFRIETGSSGETLTYNGLTFQSLSSKMIYCSGFSINSPTPRTVAIKLEPESMGGYVASLNLSPLDPRSLASTHSIYLSPGSSDPTRIFGDLKNPTGSLVYVRIDAILGGSGVLLVQEVNGPGMTQFNLSSCAN